MDAGADTGDAQNRPGRRCGWAPDAVFLAALLCVTGYAYSPSLDHAHRADQWYYFLDTMDCHGFLETFQSTYSHNRMTKSKSGGDRALFRPVLFAVLAAERTWFGYEPRGWHIVGIVLHALVVILFHCLARTLFHEAGLPQSEFAWKRTIHLLSRGAPFVLTTFFALNYAILEQVIWSHVNGYLVFLALVLGALLLVFRVRSGNSNRAALAAAWVLLLFAAFTYETGQVIAVLVAGYVALSRKSARPALAALAFCCIPVCYQAANRIDAAAHQTAGAELGGHALAKAFGDPAITLANAGHYAGYVALQPFDTGKRKVKPGSRVFIAQPDFAADPPQAGTIVIWGLLAACVAIGLMAVARSVLRDGLRSESLLRMCVLAGVLGLFAAAIVLGRMSPRGHAVLCDNSYYTYPALCVLLLILCAAMGEAARWRRSWIAVTSLALMGALAARTFPDHVDEVRSANKRMALWSRHEVAQIRDLLAWIDDHRDEPDFSLAFDTQPAEEVEKVHGIAKLWIVARRWTGARDPKYVILARDGRLRKLSLHEYRDALGPRALDPFVEVVDVGSSYNLFRHGETYFGLLHWDGSYDPRRKNYSYPAAGRSPDEVRSTYPQLIRRQAEDIAAGRFVPPADGLVLEGYRGYNILRVRSHYFAVRQGDGAFGLDRFRQRKFEDACDAPDLLSMKEAIDAVVRAGHVSASVVPRLVESSQHGYNIILIGGRYYGIRQDDGPFDLLRYQDGGYRNGVDDVSILHVKRRIREITATAAGERTRS